MDDLVLYDVHDRVAVLTLNRPDKRNALSADVLSSLQAALARAEADRDVGALVLTGAGDRVFCAGGDLGSPAGDGLLGMHEARRDFADTLLRMAALKKPIVGAAQGHALAGGFGLLLACDLVVARRDARYGTPEIKRGLFPMMIVSVMLRVLGRRRTLELALTGQEIEGDRLERWGGCNASVDAAEVLPRAKALAQQLAALSPAVLALGRRAVYEAQDMSFPQQLEFLRSQFTLNTLAEDAAEGVTAFFQKRPPEWKGR